MKPSRQFASRIRLCRSFMARMEHTRKRTWRSSGLIPFPSGRLYVRKVVTNRPRGEERDGGTKSDLLVLTRPRNLSLFGPIPKSGEPARDDLQSDPTRSRSKKSLRQKMGWR